MNPICCRIYTQRCRLLNNRPDARQIVDGACLCDYWSMQYLFPDVPLLCLHRFFRQSRPHRRAGSRVARGTRPAFCLHPPRLAEPSLLRHPRTSLAEGTPWHRFLKPIYRTYLKNKVSDPIQSEYKSSPRTSVRYFVFRHTVVEAYPVTDTICEFVMPALSR